MEAVRIYLRSGADFIEVATLSSISPPRALEGSFVPEVDLEHGGGEGLYLALVQGGHVSDLAHMLFYGGGSENDDGGEDCYSPDLSTCWGSSSHSSGGVSELEKHMFGLMGCEEDRWEDETKLDKHTFGLMGCEEDSWEDEIELDKHTFGLMECKDDRWADDTISSQDEEKDEISEEEDDEEEEEEQDEISEEGEEEEEEKDEISEEEEDESTGSDGLIFWQQGEDDEEGHKPEERHKEDQGHKEDGPEEEDIRTLQMNIKLWPLRNHALVKIFCGKTWIVTKDYRLAWLRPEEMEEFDFKLHLDKSQILRESDIVMDFEIFMACSPVLNDVIARIKPSIRNFTILKKVGGENGCKVLKCSWLGRNCAIKAVAEQISCTTEPREIDIISSLKDKHFMIFFQAWKETWMYKQEPEQQYTFIHLEFCPKTLKHALLYENRDWFPNRWFLLEEILQAIKKLHADCIVHRDLKPDNVFVGSDNGIRIGDFGDACIGHDELGMYGGTPGLGTKHYLAPELNNDGKITEKADIYSAGIIMFELFALFKTGSEKIRVFPELREKGPPDSWAGDRDLYARMTSLEPSQRPSAAEILEYIDEHHCL